MKKLTLLFMGWLFSSFLYSQAIPNVDWIRNFSEKPAITNIPSAIDASNNVYVTGYTFTGTLYDFTTLKYDQLGNLLWTAHYNGPANGDDFATAIALDGSGNVYVTGKSSGVGTGFDYATVKYNSAGVQQWAVRYNNPLANGDDEAATLLVDNSTSAVYVTGKSRGLTSGDDYTTIKYNSSGVQQWATRYNGLGNGNDKAVSIAFGTGNKLFVTGTAKGLLNNDIVSLRYNANTGTTTWTKIYNGTSNLSDACFGMVTDGNDVFICGGTQMSLTNGDYVLQKLSGNTGATQWTAFYDGYGMDDAATSIIIDGSSNPVITGFSKNTSTYEYHTVKYNSTGVQQWVRKYNASISSPIVSPKIAVDPFNYYYVCGETFNGANTDFALLQYTTSGVHNWTETHNGSANGNDAATDMVVDNFARIYITGQTYNGSAKYDYTTIKYSQTPIYAPIDFNGETALKSFQFFENKGQLINTSNALIPEVKYYTNNTSPKLYFQNTSLSYVFERLDSINPDTLDRIDLRFEQSNPFTKAYGFEPQADYLNYVLPQCPTGIDDVKGVQRLMIPNIYPLIDLHYYSNQNGLKYYFVVKPGGDPTKITMFYQGAVSSSVNVGTGELTVNSSIGSIVQDRPTPYQINGSLAIVPITAWQANYIPVGTNSYKFNIGTYNPAFPLIIQVDQGNGIPAAASTGNLNWSTYYGGGFDEFFDIKTDAVGKIYVAGYSPSSAFPTTPGVVYPFHTGTDEDVVIVKFKADGSREWATFYGGTNNDRGQAITTDAVGNVYVTGYSTSGNFPVGSPSGEFLDATNTCTGVGCTAWDLFILRLSTNGNNTPVTRWATYYGGTNGSDRGLDIAIDGNNNLFVVGSGDNTTPLVPSGTFNNTSGGGLIMQFNPARNLTWATFTGGLAAGAWVKGIDFDNANNIYLTGYVRGTGYPILNPGANATFGGGSFDAVVTKLKNVTHDLYWSTYYGGDGEDSGSRIVVDQTSGSVFITGYSNSTSTGPLPTFDPGGGAYFSGSVTGGQDAFVAEFDVNGAMLWSTYYGGTNIDAGEDIDVDNNGNIFVSGSTYSADFPIPASNLPGGYNDNSVEGTEDAFVVGFNSAEQRIWSTYFGGTGLEFGYGCATYQSSALYMTGSTSSDNTLFPLDNGLGIPYYDGSLSSGWNGFVSRFDLSIIIGITENSQNLIDFKCYPNPANNELNVSFSLESKSDVSIQLVDNLGRVIIDEDMGTMTGNVKKQIPVTNISNGMYFIKIILDNDVVTAKFIKQ